MTYLQRIDYRPTLANLTEHEQAHLQRVFAAYGAEVVIYGQPIRWEFIDEVEVVVAPHARGIGGWISKRFLTGNQERYHVGVYYGSQEAVLPNITWDSARFVLENVAFYVSKPVIYTGPEGLVRLTEI